jgi:putative oxidoreductase
MILHLDWLIDLSLLFLRLMVGLIFIDSGYSDLRDTAARSKSIGMPREFVLFLAVAELLGGFAVIIGVLQQPACLGLILVMLGAVSKKIFVWKTGFWGKNGPGWYYELVIMSMLLVVLSTDGGRYVLLR